MPSPDISSSTNIEVPEGAIFLPLSRERVLKNIESQIFQLLVGGRGPLGELPLEDKIEMHRKLSTEKNVILGITALELL